MSSIAAQLKARRLLIGATCVFGFFIGWSLLSNPTGFFAVFKSRDGHWGTPTAWLLAAAIVVAYVGSAATVSTIRHHLVRWSPLKAWSISAAVGAGILEEVITRKWVMDYLEGNAHNAVTQILMSALAFGLAHVIWGAGNLKAGVNAIISTACLGAGLAVVYLLGERSLAPCVVAHFLITALIEPGLLLAAMDDELGYLNEQPGKERHDGT